MDSHRRLLQLAMIVALMGSSLVALPRASATTPGTITVDTTSDVLGDTHCSLQEAAKLVDGLAGSDACARVGSTSIDTINFGIGSGAHTITLVSLLDFTAPVVVDGTTQPVYVGVPLIQVTGDLPGLIQLDTGSDNSTIKGLEINNLHVGGGFGFDLSILSNTAVVVSNYFSTDGAIVYGVHSTGVQLTGSSGTRIGGPTAADRNLFASEAGILLYGGSTNLFQGNYFGVTASGSNAIVGITKDSAGVGLCDYGCSSAATGNIIRDNVINGYLDGISVYTPAASNTIAGNTVGLGADGVTKLGNSTGIVLGGSTANTVGGTTAADRNIVSGNLTNIDQANAGPYTASSNVIEGNYVGTTRDGMSRVTPYGDLSGTDQFGIWLDGGAGTIIGGISPGAGNLVSVNQEGMHIGTLATGTVVRGNWFGTDATGTHAMSQMLAIGLEGAVADLGNAKDPGNNVIVASQMVGIYIFGSSGSTIYGNRIGVAATGSAAIPNVEGIGMIGASATVAQNWIANNGTGGGINLDASSTLPSGSSANCVVGNAAGVISLNTGSTAWFQGNWWGDPSGPTNGGNPLGTGDSSSNYVDYSGFLAAPPAACPNTNITVTVGGTLQGTYLLYGGQAAREAYSTLNNGPVQVQSTGGVSSLASERFVYATGSGSDHRSGSPTSYAEMMGFPTTALTTSYWFPWYNNVNMWSQLRIGNPSTVDSTTASVYLGSTLLGSYPLGPSASVRVDYPGVNGGPLRIQSSGGVPIIGAERVIYSDGNGTVQNGNHTSYFELMGFPGNQLTTDYWIPWYNNVNMWSQLRFANPDPSLSTTVSVYLGKTLLGAYPLGAASSMRVDYPSVNGGPLHITSSGGVSIIAGERVIYSEGGVQNGTHTSYSELMAVPASQLTSTYWFPSYSYPDIGTWSQLRVGNASSSLWTTVNVYLGGVLLGNYPLGPTASVRLDYLGQDGGPLEVTSTDGTPIFAAVRVIQSVSGTQTSYSEITGYPDNQLTTSYLFPWYNNFNFDSQLRIAVP